MTETKLHKLRVTVFVDNHPDKEEDDMTIYSELEARELKPYLKNYVGDMLTFLKYDSSNDKIMTK